MTQTASDQAFLLILVSVCLGACLVWTFWEIEEGRRRRQRHLELVHEARRSVKSGH